MSDYEPYEDDDFVVRVRPFKDDEGYWNGELDISVVTSAGNELDDDDYFSLMHFCKMMAATVPIMEVNEDLRELVHNYVLEKIDKHYEVELEDKPEVTNTEGNVVTINFGTKTKGSA